MIGLNEIFEKDKLPSYFSDFEDKRILIVGVGAVGSYLAEALIKMKIYSLTLIDMDSLEAGNYSKSSGIYRYPEDLGRNKAIAMADRLNSLLDSDKVKGIDASITSFGPMAFAEFDLIILALDNYGSKLYVNQCWKQLAKSNRPLLVFGGTINETAQSNCLDGEEACVRCLFDERWLKNPFRRTSCSGPQYRIEEASGEVVVTTGLASRIASDIMAEQSRAYFLGYHQMINMRTIYNPFPSIGIIQSHPLSRKDCPDCKSYKPVDDAIELEGLDVVRSTVGDLLLALKNKLKCDDYEVYIPRYEFGGVIYGKLICDDYCRNCGREIRKIYRHEFRTREKDLLCDECREKKTDVIRTGSSDRAGSYISGISLNNVDESLKSKTLYEIGFPVGGFITVCIRGQGLDAIDDGFATHTFYCGNDRKALHTVTKLEG